MGLLTRACGWLAFSSLIAAQAQTAATTSQTAAASANFTYVSDDGCILNEVIVFANRTTVVKANTPPRTTAEVMYTRYRYNYCEDADLGTDLGTSPRPAFSGDLNRASLNATINGHTASGSAVTVSFVLLWEGKGGITRKVGRPANAPAGSAKSIPTESLNRNAVVTGSMDERDISDAAVGASLHTTRKSISQ